MGSDFIMTPFYPYLKHMNTCQNYPYPSQKNPLQNNPEQHPFRSSLHQSYFFKHCKDSGEGPKCKKLKEVHHIINFLNPF